MGGKASPLPAPVPGPGCPGYGEKPSESCPVSNVEPSGFVLSRAVGCGARRVKKVTSVWLEVPRVPELEMERGLGLSRPGHVGIVRLIRPKWHWWGETDMQVGGEQGLVVWTDHCGEERGPFGHPPKSLPGSSQQGGQSHGITGWKEPQDKSSVSQPVLQMRKFRGGKGLFLWLQH